MQDTFPISKLCVGVLTSVLGQLVGSCEGKQGLKADTELACTGLLLSFLFTKFYTSITDKDCSGVTDLL